MMRYRGGGVGHKSTRKATDWFLSDRDKLDEGGNEDEELNEAMEDVDIDGTVLDLNDDVDEDEIEEYGYDGIEEIEEGDEDEDEEQSDGEDGQVIDDAGLGAEDGEDDEDDDNGYAEL
jgi:hypothetical protein